ncbi:MAG: hypothetical protein HYZ00_04395 [Candidatus Hydrogenedentes bacterium]|nr:hypothetical protein [Candidatus Hydrogenedentota bacterium]
MGVKKTLQPLVAVFLAIGFQSCATDQTPRLTAEWQTENFLNAEQGSPISLAEAGEDFTLTMWFKDFAVDQDVPLLSLDMPRDMFTTPGKPADATPRLRLVLSKGKLGGAWPSGDLKLFDENSTLDPSVWNALTLTMSQSRTDGEEGRVFLNGKGGLHWLVVPQCSKRDANAQIHLADQGVTLESIRLYEKAFTQRTVKEFYTANPSPTPSPVALWFHPDSGQHGEGAPPRALSGGDQLIYTTGYRASGEEMVSEPDWAQIQGKIGSSASAKN